MPGPQPLRLPPGVDLRTALHALVRERGEGAFVVAGIGSLSTLRLRLAGASAGIEPMVERDGAFEILSLCGSLAADGVHLHMAVADEQGRVIGGHVAPGCIVRTTVEALLAWLPEWQLSRSPDPATGYAELVAMPRRP